MCYNEVVMKYKLLIVDLCGSTNDKQYLTASYFDWRTPLDIEWTVAPFSTPSDRLTIIDWNLPDKAGNALLGTGNLRETLRALNVVAKEYNAVVVFYDSKKVKNAPVKAQNLRHWTHWNPYDGAALIEIARHPSFPNTVDDDVRVLTHELLHAFHQACRLNGVTTVDTMDLYDKEYETYATDGNRERNISEIESKNAWESVTKQPYLFVWATLLMAKVALYLLPKEESMPEKILKWANATKKHEGWYEGSRSYRNNNPGNFRYSKVGYLAKYGNVGKDKDNFAVFPTYEKGWLYLCNFLKQCAQGKNATYNKDGSLYDFYAKYAPSSDKNDPKRYAEVVAKEIGVDPSAPISSLVS